MRVSWLLAGVLVMLPMVVTAENLDTSFSDDGRDLIFTPFANYRSIAMLPLANGESVVVFETPSFSLCATPICVGMYRLAADGSVTTSDFRQTSWGSIAAAAVDNSGRIVVVGSTLAGPNGIDFGVMRFNQNLSPDTSFAGGATSVSLGTQDDIPTAVAVDRLDRIVVAGLKTFAAGADSDFGIVRLRSDGTLDPSFNGSGMKSIAYDLAPTQKFDFVNAVTIGNDGKILMVGVAYDGTLGYARVALARLGNDGTLDASFCNGGCTNNAGYNSIANGRTIYYFGTGNGHADIANGIDVLDNGGFVIVGNSYETTGNTPHGAITRFLANGTAVAETLETGVGGAAQFSSVRASDAIGSRFIVAGHNGSGPNSVLLQAFDTNVQPVLNYGNCLTNNSGFCLTRFGDASSSDVGPDDGRTVTLDAGGRPLLAGDIVPTSGSFRYVLTARFTNSSGPKPDLIFRNGFN